MEKKWITGLILTLGMLLGTHLYGQGDTYRRTEEYCKVWMLNDVGRSGVEARIDYGQERNSVADIQIRDESGRPVRFHSAMDALNYLNGEGWELVTAIYDHEHVNMFYLMRRKR